MRDSLGVSELGGESQHGEWKPPPFSSFNVNPGDILKGA